MLRLIIDGPTLVLFFSKDSVLRRFQRPVIDLQRILCGIGTSMVGRVAYFELALEINVLWATLILGQNHMTERMAI